MFARSDDVNLAYQAANPLVNFQQPEQSTLVLQVRSGHNCWVADPKACADTMRLDQGWVGTRLRFHHHSDTADAPRCGGGKRSRRQCGRTDLDPASRP